MQAMISQHQVCSSVFFQRFASCALEWAFVPLLANLTNDCKRLKPFLANEDSLVGAESLKHHFKAATAIYSSLFAKAIDQLLRGISPFSHWATSLCSAQANRRL